MPDLTLAQLKTEILSGPLAADLAPHVDAGDDGRVLAILQDKRFTKNERVALRDIVRYLLDNSLWLDIVDAASGADSPAKTAARVFVEIQKMGFVESLDMSKATAAGLLDALVSGGIIGAGDKDAIIAMGVIPANRMEVLEANVSIQEIAQALRGDV